MSRWTPCVYEFASEAGKVVGSPYEASLIGDTANLMLTYLIPLSTNRGNKRLHIQGVRVGLSFADSANRVLEVHMRGIKDKGADVIWKEPTDVIAPQRIERGFAPIDVSNYQAVKVLVYVQGTTEHAVRVGYVSANISYQ